MWRLLLLSCAVASFHFVSFCFLVRVYKTRKMGINEKDRKHTRQPKYRIFRSNLFAWARLTWGLKTKKKKKRLPRWNWHCMKFDGDIFPRFFFFHSLWKKSTQIYIVYYFTPAMWTFKICLTECNGKKFKWDSNRRKKIKAWTILPAAKYTLTSILH